MACQPEGPNPSPLLRAPHGIPGAGAALGAPKAGSRKGGASRSFSLSVLGSAARALLSRVIFSGSASPALVLRAGCCMEVTKVWKDKLITLGNVITATSTHALPFLSIYKSLIKSHIPYKESHFRFYFSNTLKWWDIDTALQSNSLGWIHGTDLIKWIMLSWWFCILFITF